MEFKTCYFLLKIELDPEYPIEEAANDIEEEAEAEVVDYMYLEPTEDEEEFPYIAY